ncbi:hypothetical protein V2J09_021466 [Rumex salicifolius]
MENAVLETNPSTKCDRSSNHKSKKRKRPFSKDISLQKKSCDIVEADSSHSPATDAYAQPEAGNLKSQRKEKNKKLSTDREAADSKSDIACWSLKTEAAESIICNQSQDTNAKKRKRSRKKKKSTPNAGNNCEANGFSSHHGEDLFPSAVSAMCNQATVEVSEPLRMEFDKARSSDLDREAANGIDSSPSTIFDQSKEPKAKKRKKQRKSKKIIDSISNGKSNYEAIDISSQEKSRQGGDLSLSAVSYKCNLAVAEVLQPQRKRIDKAGSDHTSIVNQDIDSVPLTVCDQSMKPKAKKRKKRRKSKKIIDTTSNADTNPEHGGNSVQEKVSFGSSSFVDQFHVNCEPRNVKSPSLLTNPAGLSSRKLLILDLNGLLADIRSVPLKGFKPHRWIVNKAVYKRPFCDDFVKFCFETFDVAVWSSRKRFNVERMLKFLMKEDKREKLIFTWDQSHCTKTGFMTIENKDKPIFLKELQKWWNKSNPKCPSDREKAVYNESNTLLIDDSPCKALRNPFKWSESSHLFWPAVLSLGPNGDLRLYLKRLAEADNVQEFVKENPFGQIPVTNSHPSWDFYSKIFAPKSPTNKKMSAHYPLADIQNKKTVFDDLSDNVTP